MARSAARRSLAGDRHLGKIPPDGLRYRWRARDRQRLCRAGGGRRPRFVHDRKLARDAANPASAFDRGLIRGTERVVCLDEKDGRELWVHEYDCPYTISYAAGPRATPLVHQGKVYTLGAEGHLHCLEAATGKIALVAGIHKGFRVQDPDLGFLRSSPAGRTETDLPGGRRRQRGGGV